VLAASAGALPEVAGAGAVYADPLDVRSLADGLARAAAPEGRARRLREGRARLKLYTWERSALQHLAAYRAAAGRGSA
jgi:glycosyltransferase involved in cell wall biosynthesis